MFYVQRDAQGALVRVEAAAFTESTETLPADHHEIQAWYANEVVETSLAQLKQSDLEMIRVLGEKGSRLAVSDAGVAILFAQAALEGASLNIFINTKMMKDQEEAERLNYLADQLIATGKELKETTYDAVLKGIRP